MKLICIILYLILCVLLGAISDGLNTGRGKSLGHILRAVEVFSLLSLGYIFPSGYVVMLIAYTLFRIALFDYAFNLASGQTFFHMGTTNVWDRVVGSWPVVPVLMAKVILFIAGVFVIIQEL